MDGKNNKDGNHHVHSLDGHVHGHQDHVHGHRGHVHDHRGHAHGNQDHLHDHHVGRVHDHHGHHATTHPYDIHAGHANHHDIHHTPLHSPHSRHSLSNPAGGSTPNHDHVHSAQHAPGGHHDNHNGEARRRDHELHWDRHQVHKLRGMITDPHYKEQLDVDGGRVYPWSSQYEGNKTSNEDLQDLKNCRYLRFSKLNLEGMKDNPEKEVEVFERKETPS